MSVQLNRNKDLRASPQGLNAKEMGVNNQSKCSVVVKYVKHRYDTLDNRRRLV